RIPGATAMNASDAISDPTAGPWPMPATRAGGDSPGIWPFLFPTPQAKKPVDTGRFGWPLFLLTTSLLLVRPVDVFPGLMDLPICQPAIIAAVAFSIPRLRYHLSSASHAQPITLLIMGICACIVFSHLARGAVYDARAGGFEFFKVF